MLGMWQSKKDAVHNVVGSPTFRLEHARLPSSHPTYMLPVHATESRQSSEEGFWEGGHRLRTRLPSADRDVSTFMGRPMASRCADGIRDQ